MAKNDTFATAMFRDTYAGNVAVKLVKRGAGFIWTGVDHMVVCGYRPVPTVNRACANARADRRFSVVEG